MNCIKPFKRKEFLTLIPVIIEFPLRLEKYTSWERNKKHVTEKGVMLKDNNDQAMVYPLTVNPIKSPVHFVYETTLIGQELARSMIKKAYLNHVDILISPKIKVHWFEYEVFLKKCSFYKNEKKAKIDDKWNLNLNKES